MAVYGSKWIFSNNNVCAEMSFCQKESNKGEATILALCVEKDKRADCSNLHNHGFSFFSRMTHVCIAIVHIWFDIVCCLFGLWPCYIFSHPYFFTFHFLLFPLLMTFTTTTTNLMIHSTSGNANRAYIGGAISLTAGLVLGTTRLLGYNFW